MSTPSRSKFANPPKRIEKLLRWSLPKELKEPILGDLAEEYLAMLAHTPNKANYWYTRQALCTGLQFLTKTKRGLIMFLFGVAVFVTFIFIAMIMSGGILMFLNVPSLLIVMPPAVFLTLACSSKKSVQHAFTVMLSERLDFEKIELVTAKQVFNTFGNMNMLMGWIGVIIGAIAMASNIESEVFSQVFGPAFAVFLLTLFYALLIKTLCYGAEAKIQFKIINLAS
jgi:chemotaxis protein MotA